MLFELDKYDRKLHTLDPAVPRSPYQFATNVEKRSLLYWAEHCQECAAPSCYETCDLYQPRTDTRCRRFTFGALKNRNFASPRGYGVEISFKKWAKMAAFANLRLSAPATVVWGERLVELASPAANMFGKLMARLKRKVRWKALAHEGLEEAVRRLHRSRPRQALPDAFLLEVYNPTDTPVRMQLLFSTLPSTDGGLVQLAPHFATTIACSVGYSRHEIDFNLLHSVASSNQGFLISMAPEADNNARLVFLTAEFVKFAPRPAIAQETRPVKCVVFDLDNTLWDGVLVEGDSLAMQPKTRALIKHLDERGILLSVASKNDHASAWQKIEQFGLSEYFLYPQINWSPKSQSMRAIAERLNIGVDSLAFVDDNPFELDEVTRACPQVLCINATQIPSLTADPRLQGSSTPDARARRQMYRQSAARETAQETFGSDYLSFLASCEIELEVSDYSPEQQERVAELVQRTNQLNFSGHKHTRQELQDLLANPRLEKFVLQCSDRYGSYGTVGFCLAEFTPEAICVHDFMLSCRVQGKLIEKAFFHHLLEQHNPHAATQLWMNFRPTQRNKPAQQVLESLGFRQCDIAFGGSTHGMISSSSESLRCDVIRVRCSTPVHQAGPAANLNSQIGELNYERL